MIRKIHQVPMALWMVLIFGLSLSSCSLNKTVINGVADAVSKGGGITFTGEDDPQIVGDALPFALKFYESILEQTPEHQDLLLSTGSAYIMYANAYLQTPATMMSTSDVSKKEEMMSRAKKFYLRGRDMLMRALEVRHPGFLNLVNQNKMTDAVASMTKEDVPFLYWTGAGWMGAYSINAFDINLSVGVQKAVALMNKALELNETFNNGAIHDFFIAYYASMPQGMGGNDDKARYHFEKTVEISKGKSASPYVSLATSICIRTQNVKEFKKLLTQALAIDVNQDITNRLANVINQKKAKWYLEHVEDFFLN